MSFFGKGSLKDGKWYARKCDFPLEGGFGSGCKQAIGMATEKILPAPPPLKRKPCCLVVSLGNGSHRLLLYLTASRLALQPSLFFMAVAAVAGVAAASQNASGNRSSVGNKPLANGTLHTPMV